jgi:hypothetical protein
MAHARLVVVADHQTLCITSVDGLSRDPDSIRATDWPTVATLRASDRTPRFWRDPASWPAHGMWPLDALVLQPALPGDPWPAGGQQPPRSGLRERPWRVYEVSVGLDGERRVRVVRPGAFEAFGWGVMLAGAAAVWWLARNRARWVVPVLLISALMALFVAEIAVPITANWFLGTLLGSLLAVLFGISGRPRETAAGGSRAFRGALTAGAGIVAVGLLAAARTRAEEPAAPANDDARQTVYQVIVPVDEQLQPVGQYDYLPLPFYDALHQRVRAESDPTSGWLVRRATYLARFQWQPLRTALELASMTAIYQVEVFRPGQQVVFPWNGNSPDVQVLEASLAGQPVELSWNGDRTAFSLRVDAEGISQLELVLRPQTRELPHGRIIRFGIPAIAQSELHVQSAFGSPPVDVVSARGSIYVNTELGEQHAELGPTSVLHLEWPMGSDPSSLTRPLDLQQLLWLKVRPKEYPQAVVLDARFRITAPTRRVDALRWTVDRRLQLLPLPAGSKLEVTEHSDAETEERIVAVRFREPIGEESLVHLQFLVEQTTGLGNLSVPALQPLDGRVTRRWLAVSLSSDLEYTPGSSERLQPMDAAEFLSVWGEATSAPSVCYRVAEDDPHWFLAVRSRKVRTESRQQLDISIRGGTATLAFDADLDAPQGEVFQHRLSVSPALVVDLIELITPQGAVPVRARHDGSGTITVFAGQGLSGKHHLRLRGHQPIPEETAELTLPHISLVDGSLRGHRTRVYRHSDVLVEIVGAPTPMASAPVPMGTFQEPHGRFVAAFEQNEEGATGSPAVRLRVSPNRPQVEARLVTHVRRVADLWEVVVDFDARLADPESGVMDKFLFEIPPEWTEPLTLDPPVPYRTRSLPGARRQLIIEPVQPAVDPFTVRIRGNLELGPHERGRTPNIVPLGVLSRAERFFVLPTQLDQQRIEWKTSGLYKLGPGDTPIPGWENSADHVAYRVWARRPRAVIADVQRVADVRRITLADVHVSCHADGEYFGVVTYALEPAGSTHCVLEVPPDQELIRVTVEGIPATLIPLADQRWNVRLNAEQLPQQLTAVFRGRWEPPLAANPQLMRVPWITDYDVSATLWTLRSPPDRELIATGAGSHRVTSLTQNTLRLRNMADLIESAADTVLDRPTDEVHAWYTPWAARWTATWARMIREAKTTTPTPPEGNPKAIQSLELQQRALARRLQAESILDRVLEDTGGYPQAGDLWALSGHPAAATTHYAFAGGSPILAVTSVGTSRSAPTWWPRLLLAAAIALAGGGLVAGWVPRGIITDSLRRWPAVSGVLLGLVWWLFASPSVFGWVIIAISVWAAFRLPLPYRRVPRMPAESLSGDPVG